MARMMEKSEPQSEWDDRDVWLLFSARFIRMLSYGGITTVLLRFLLAVGLSATDVGIILFGIMLGDLFITLYLTTEADTIGRVKVLVVGATLKLLAGTAFARSTSFYWLLASGIIGVINPIGGEIGPYLATEQAALTDVIVRIHMSSTSLNFSSVRSSTAVTSRLAEIFGYYNALGFVALALGNVLGGVIVQQVELQYGELVAFRMMFVIYAMMAAIMILIYLLLSPNAEVDKEFMALTASISTPIDSPVEWYYFGIRRKKSRAIVGPLSLLFAMDAFAGGFAIPTSIVVWLSKRWFMDSAQMGLILSATSVLSGLSAIISGYMVKRFGAVQTVILTQMPSNLFLVLVPFMPSATSAVCMLFLRFSMSSMHMPATQAYLATVVSSSERSAAGGIANVVRSLGLAISAIPLAYLQSAPALSLKFSLPFFLCGGIKSLYDLLLYILYKLTKNNSPTPAKVAFVEHAEEQPLLSK
jgi:MFS family permease